MWRSFAGLRSTQFTARAARAGTRAHGPFSAARGFAEAKPKEKMTLKKLTKEYGWTAFGIYTAFSFIDLPLSFMLVHSAGQERLENWEIGIRGMIGADTEREHTYVHKASKGGKSLFWAEFGIAYIIHKSLIFLRLPATVAVTPRVASKLAQWGFRVKGAVPSVDKQVLVNQVASKAAQSNSATVRKAADALSLETKVPSSKIIDEAAKKVTASSAESAQKARQVLKDAKDQVEKQIKK